MDRDLASFTPVTILKLSHNRLVNMNVFAKI